MKLRCLDIWVLPSVFIIRTYPGIPSRQITSAPRTEPWNHEETALFLGTQVRAIQGESPHQDL